jgi:hypothetical protein
MLDRRHGRKGPGGPITVSCGNVAATFYTEGMIMFGDITITPHQPRHDPPYLDRYYAVIGQIVSSLHSVEKYL